ncbi:MAG: hypothetical protein JNM68_16480, partial [Dinghuibacter sp.]|nr:hypothetical protein [Dinghuibacter sp.]
TSTSNSGMCYMQHVNPNCSAGALAMQPNTTYYWRIWNGSSHTTGQSFSVPACGGGGCTADASFVTRVGNQFRYNNKQFRFAGVNMPHLQQLAEDTRIQQRINSAYSKGIRVIRLFAAQNGVNNATAISKVHRIINTLSPADMKFIVVLANEYSDGGMFPQGCEDWYNGGPYLRAEFFDINSAYYQKYKNWVQQITTTAGLSNSNKILAWELGNEITNPGGITNMRTFVSTTAAQIKANSCKNLVTTGFLRLAHASYTNIPGYGADIYDNTNIDFITIHAYDNDWTTDYQNAVQTEINIAEQRNKPYIIEEVGFRSRTDASCHGQQIRFPGGGIGSTGAGLRACGEKDRAGTMSDLFNYIFGTIGCDGAAMWGYYDGDDGNTGDNCFGFQTGVFVDFGSLSCVYQKWNGLFNNGAFGCSFSRTATTAGISEVSGKPAQEIPATESIKVAPNPFTGNTTITYTLQQPAKVLVTITNLNGQKVRTLSADTKQPGTYSLNWNGHNEQNRLLP